MIRKLNAKLLGWVGFYQYVDKRDIVFRRIDGTLLWKLA